MAAVSTELFECESSCVEWPESLDVTDPDVSVLRSGRLESEVTLLLSALRSTEDSSGGMRGGGAPAWWG